MKIINDLSNHCSIQNAHKIIKINSSTTTINCFSKWMLVHCQWSCRKIKIEVKQQIKCTLQAHNNSSNIQILSPNGAQFITKYSVLQLSVPWHNIIITFWICIIVRKSTKIIASSIASYFEHNAISCWNQHKKSVSKYSAQPRAKFNADETLYIHITDNWKQLMLMKIIFKSSFLYD